MPSINRTTNPTGVIRVDSGAISLRVIKGVRPGDPKSFFIERFSAQRAGLLGSLRIGCLATAGQTSQYADLGSVASPDVTPKQLNELANDSALRFRVIFFEPLDAKIVAAADNIKALDDSELSQSLVSIQPGELSGPLWKLELSESSSENLPVVHVEEQLYPSAKVAAMNPQFVSFVLPEVLRQIATRVALEWDDIDREGSWLGRWSEFLENLNPNSIVELEEEKRLDWADECVELFCKRGHMIAALNVVLSEARGEK